MSSKPSSTTSSSKKKDSDGFTCADLAYDKSLQRSVNVYKETPTITTQSPSSSSSGGSLRGIWANNFPNSMMSTIQEVWVFEHGKQPIDMYEPHNDIVHGVWGYAKSAPHVIDAAVVSPSQLLFYHHDENLKLPKTFKVEGAWMLPIYPILSDIQAMDVGSTSLFAVGKHVDDKSSLDEVFDVPGQWNLLYHRDGHDDYSNNGRKPEKKVARELSLPNSVTQPPPASRIKVHVEKLSDGTTFTLDDLDPTTTTIVELKKKIQNVDGVPVKSQDLYFDGTELDNGDAPINQYGIQNGDTLHLDSMMKIYVEKATNSKQVYTLKNVKPTDTIKYIQHRLEDDHEIPMKEQRLTFTGKQLKHKDESPLYEHGIHDGDTLKLEPMMIKVKTLAGEVVQLNNVEPLFTIAKIKQMIQNRIGIKPENQRILHPDGHEITRKNNMSLRSCNIQHGDLLELAPMIIKIQNTSDGKLFPLRVDPTNTIKDIKLKIEDREGVPIEQQRLLHPKDGNSEMSNDKATLKDIGIKHGDTLNLETGMNIKVKTPEGDYIPLHNVKPTDKIADIKKMIHSTEGTPIDAQLLSFDEKDLNDNTNEDSGPVYTLDDYNIVNGSIVDMDHMMQIYIQFPNNGRRITMNVIPTWTIKLVKVELQKVCNNDNHHDSNNFIVNDHVMLYRGKLLENKSNLKRYNIQHRSTVHLEVIPETTVTMSPWQTAFDFSASSSNSGKSTHRKSVDKDGLIKERRIPSDWLQFYEMEKQKGKTAAVAKANGREFIVEKNGSSKKKQYAE